MRTIGVEDSAALRYSTRKKARPLLTAIAVAVGACVFDLAYTQYPLHDGNYATYALHALACAGVGQLRTDWFAYTTDPFPVVTALTCATYRLGAPTLLYAFHATLLGLYLAALVSLFSTIYRATWSNAKSVALAGAIVIAHSAMFRAGVEAVTGADWAWYLQSGIAMQYLLGFVFQPSLFGVFLVASVAAFARRRDTLAIALGAGATVAHFSYLLTFLFLVASYALVRGLDALDEGWRNAVRAASRPALVGALLVTPVLVLVAIRFAPTSARTFARAQHVLAEVRIPHHALAQRWAQPRLAIACSVLVLAVGAVRQHRFAVLLLTLTALTGLFTAIQVVTGNLTCALLFPWRASALIVPLATATILATAIAKLKSNARTERVVMMVMVTASLAAAAFVRSRCGVTSMTTAKRTRRYR